MHVFCSCQPMTKYWSFVLMPCEQCSMCFHWPKRIIEANQIAFNIINAEVGGRIIYSQKSEIQLSWHIFFIVFCYDMNASCSCNHQVMVYHLQDCR